MRVSKQARPRGFEPLTFGSVVSSARWDPSVYGGLRRSDVLRVRVIRVYNVRTMASAARSQRIDVRVTDEQNAVIREAAAVAGQTVTAFLLSAAEARARCLLDERRHLVMSHAAFAQFAAALDAPVESVPAMRELFELPRIDGE
jgi:uncharacterized protein (DUF1778 family)